MKRLFLFFSISFLSLQLIQAQTTYKEWVEKSLSAIEHDSLSVAEHCLYQALKLEPDNPKNALLFSNLGTLQRNRHHYEQAVESYTFALNFAPESVPILLNRATLYMELGRYELARIDYALVIDVDKNNEEALLMRAYIYMKQRNYKESLADYEQLLKVNPFNYNARLGLATLYQKNGKYNDAEAVLGAMIQEYNEKQSWGKRSQAMVYVARAGLQQEQEHYEMALIDLEEAIKLDMNLADIYLMRGQIYKVMKRPDLAKNDFERCVKLGMPMTDMRELIRGCK